MMNMDQIYLVKDIEGYSPHISRLISMMNYARHTTLQAVENLTVDQLDYLLDDQSNSIGALLLHCAAVETAYQVGTFERRALTDEEVARLEPALNLGDRARAEIRGHEISYYLNKLDEVRARTCELFRTVDDNWLHFEVPFWDGKPGNIYFMWFHVFEDEINHRGQIRLIKNKIQL
ncbi:DUF664 domain-containing protein [Paenibacillus albiflavus]|uniref:DUF664 domain-containing protein n=1 Tax=Paenibacillus albiflavus TaxID=2545760 RepID=A0A4R4ER48_9BACL|nr:DinB family protein [Paenibacillus albiflavus]TCZ80888.1 DUF664 domain-containing protein [Paenibacillus albiflavus]